MIEQGKIETVVRRFFDAFEKLSSDEKVYFLAAIDKQLRVLTENDRKLYLGLMASARLKQTPEQAISALKRKLS